MVYQKTYISLKKGSTHVSIKNIMFLTHKKKIKKNKKTESKQYKTGSNIIHIIIHLLQMEHYDIDSILGATKNIVTTGGNRTPILRETEKDSSSAVMKKKQGSLVGTCGSPRRQPLWMGFQRNAIVPWADLRCAGRTASENGQVVIPPNSKQQHWNDGLGWGEWYQWFQRGTI